MSRLTREDALAFYERFYGPRNAFLVVVGDVEPEAVVRTARETYGQVSSNGAAPRAARRQEPEHRPAVRRGAGRACLNAALYRTYLAPSRATAQPGEAEALEVLMRVLAQGETSRLHARLVAERQLAVAVEGGYSGLMRDSGEVAVYALARNTAALAEIEAEIDRALAEIVEQGVTADELERARGDRGEARLRCRQPADAGARLRRRAGRGARPGGRRAAARAPRRRHRRGRAAGRGEPPLRERSVTGVLLPAGAEGFQARARAANSKAGFDVA